MVNIKKFKKFPMLLLGSIGLFCAFAAKAQYAPEWDDYKRWGLHVDKVWYLPARADKKEGVYDIENYVMPGINFGFEYNFRIHETWSFFTGLDMDFLPFYNYDFDPYVTNAELPYDSQIVGGGTFWNGYFASKWVNAHNVFSIPIGVTVKKTLSPKFFTNISASTCIKLMQSGSWGISKPTLDAQGRGMDFFTLEAETASRTIFYPCANLSAGINYMTKYSLIRLSLKLQKSIVPFFKGEYSFQNLAQSPDTYGTYKVQGDYFGLGITVTPRKIKTLKY